MSASHRQPALSFVFVTLLLAMTGVGLLTPVLPKLVVQLGGNDLASGSRMYGWLVSIFSLMQFLASPVLGSLSDRFGRRRIILIATAGSAIDYVIMANAPTMGWLFLARTISGATAGVMATANAYVVDVTPPERRAQAFGLLGAAFGAGFMIGPAIGGFLGDVSLRLPFWFAAGCSALNWLWGFFVLPESLAPEHRRSFDWHRANPLGALLAMRRFPSVLGLAGCYFLLWIAQSMLYATWALYTGERFGWTPSDVGLSLTVVGLLMAYVQAVLVKRIVPALGDTRAILVGLIISAMAYLGYGFSSHGWMIYAVLCLGALAGISGPALQSHTTRHVPPSEQGAVQGVFVGLASLANIPGPAIATWSFAWAVTPRHAITLPSWLHGLESALNMVSAKLLPHSPGIPFFEAALVVVAAIVVAMRSFRAEAATAKPLEPAPTSAAS